MSGGVEPELDTAALVRATPTKRLKNEPIGKFLGRITHLSLNGKGLSRVVRNLSSSASHAFLTERPSPVQDYLAHCPNVRVLYLFENRLTGLEGLEACPLVTHLYLQNNSLTDTDGMAALTHLTKLYVFTVYMALCVPEWPVHHV